MIMKKYSLLTSILIALFGSCKDPYEGTTYLTDTGDELEMTCAAVLSKNSDDFSLWVELLKYADYYNALNDADATAIVFCPTNEAMREFLAWKEVESVSELDREYARAVVQQHIINNYTLSDEMLANYAKNGENIPGQTLFDNYLSTGFGYTITDVDDAERDNTIYNTDSIYLNNQAKLENFVSTKTANGEIFIMGDVIRPVAETVLERLRPYDEYNIFIEAAERCGYDKIVAREADTTYNIDGSFSVTAINFTCLAVPDEVFAASGINSVDDLCSHLGAGSNYTEPTNELYRYIAYHFFDKIQYISDFFHFDEEGQINIFDTEYTYQVVTCEDIAGIHTFNKRGHIIRSDMPAHNGVIHKIDDILPVWEPEPVTVIWDFCNTAEIISFVNAYGAATSSGAYFTSPLTSSDNILDLSEDKSDGDYGNISAFVEDETYLATPVSGGYRSYRKIGFVKCKSKSKTNLTENIYGAYMNNLLELNLGYGGWVELESPTIIKGRYKVELFYGANSVLKPFCGGGSRTRFILDNDETSDVYIYKGVTLPANNYGLYSVELWGNVEFENSEKHTLKGQMMDINAKTNNDYHQLWDYVKFTPIE